MQPEVMFVTRRADFGSWSHDDIALGQAMSAEWKLLRDAFDKTMKDPEFLADAKRQKLDVEPKDGAHLEQLVRDIYATPRPIIEKIGKLIQ